MKRKSYKIKKLSSKQVEELRLACKRQYLEDSYKKTNPTAVVEVVVGDINSTVNKYRQRGYKRCHDFGNTLHQHLLVFVKD